MEIEDSRLLLATAPNSFYKNYHRRGDLVMLLYILTIKPRYNFTLRHGNKEKKRASLGGSFYVKN